MLRNILMTLPALAFALPIITATPADAGEPRWGDQGQGQKPPKPGKDEGYVSVEIGLEFCVMAQVLAENRACEIVDPELGIARCDARGGKPTPPYTPTQKPDKPGKDEGGLIFVEVASCTALGVNIDLKN